MTDQYMEIKIKELEDRVNVLEQESFVNKPCIARHVFCHEDKIKVLDKIRTKVAEEHNDYVMSEQYDTAYGLELALGIIDEYRGESEE